MPGFIGSPRAAGHAAGDLHRCRNLLHWFRRL
jgi:hypothetical protein